MGPISPALVSSQAGGAAGLGEQHLWGTLTGPGRAGRLAAGHMAVRSTASASPGPGPDLGHLPHPHRQKPSRLQCASRAGFPSRGPPSSSGPRVVPFLHPPNTQGQSRNPHLLSMYLFRAWAWSWGHRGSQEEAQAGEGTGSQQRGPGGSLGKGLQLGPEAMSGQEAGGMPRPSGLHLQQNKLHEGPSACHPMPSSHFPVT